jgi:hypothetical protein
VGGVAGVSFVWTAGLFVVGVGLALLLAGTLLANYMHMRDLRGSTDWIGRWFIGSTKSWMFRAMESEEAQKLEDESLLGRAANRVLMLGTFCTILGGMILGLSAISGRIWP